jgi:hypothetical protein
MTVMKTKSPKAIRLSINKEVDTALKIARRRYPALSDAEILKLGLSNIVSNRASSDNNADEELEEIRAAAANAVGFDYLNDPDEDAYAEELLKNARARNENTKNI